jgi:hypothetical protein
MVCIATVAGIVVGAILALFAGSGADGAAPDAAEALLGGTIAIVAALLVGVLFCVVTLFFAALTMPPALGLARWLNLPRPAIDIIGGGAVGLLCAFIGVDIFDADKFRDLLDGPAKQIFASVGLAAGCLLGYVRWAILARQAPQRATQLAV